MWLDDTAQEAKLYFLAAARRAGVPDPWIEDAAADIAIAVWQADTSHWKQVVRHRAIDAARRYGPHGKTGQSRETSELSDAIPVRGDPYAVVERILDFRAAWRRLAPGERRVIVERLRAGVGWSNGSIRRKAPWDNAHQQRVSQARRRLRRLMT